MKQVLPLLGIGFLALGPAWSAPAAAGVTNRPVIIFNTDMGSDVDDAGALALLHRLADLGEVELAGVIFSSGKNRFGVGVCDAINTWSSWDQVAVLYTARPHLFEVQRGTLRHTSGPNVVWKSTATDSKHYRVLPTISQNALAELIEDLMAQPPHQGG